MPRLKMCEDISYLHTPKGLYGTHRDNFILFCIDNSTLEVIYI
jgi:hypothetical protein